MSQGTTPSDGTTLPHRGRRIEPRSRSTSSNDITQLSFCLLPEIYRSASTRPLQCLGLSSGSPVNRDTARQQVNHAQVERGRQAREHFEETSPVAPAIRNIDRSVEFLDLVTACHAFVAASGRVVPGLRDRQLGDDERTIVDENVTRVRATLDWIEMAVDTGKATSTTGLRAGQAGRGVRPVQGASAPCTRCSPRSALRTPGR
ncbi:hypothetical protein SHXM_01845 [Streptomyces hygroscopicus]|nr:hypothetical protein SHXM_01845 [Streptomyces hygroscopicus]